MIIARAAFTSNLVRLWRIETCRPNQLDLRDRKLGRTIELIVVVSIAASALILGARTYRENIASAGFYQSSFGPALNFACNGKFNPIKPNEAVQNFLEQTSSNPPACRDIEDLPNKKLNTLEVSMAYLEIACSLVWKVSGVDWGSLSLIAAMLTAGFALANYSLFRVLCKSRLLCAALTLIVLKSWPVVSQIPHLRDFSKAPFIIGALACLAAATLRARTLPAMTAYAVLSGSLVSIGLGFRSDVIAVVPIACISPFFVLGSDRPRRVIARMCLMLAGFFSAYIVFQLPLLQLKDGNEFAGSFLPHVLVLGFAEQFLQTALGMPEVPYTGFRTYLDQFVVSAVQLFSGTCILWGSALYEQKTADLLKSMVLLLPHDTFMRIFYVAHQVGRLGLNAAIWGVPLLVIAPFLVLTRPRSFLFVSVTFGIFSTLLALQYDVRHAFYMVFLAPAIVALSCSAIAELFRYYTTHPRHLPEGLCTNGALSALAMISLAAIVGGLSMFLASIQGHALQELAERYESLNWQPIYYRSIEDRIEPVPVAGVYSFRKGEQTGATPAPYAGIEAFARLRFRLEPADAPEVLPIELSWIAHQGEVTDISREGFSARARKPGYVVKSTPISSADIAARLAEKSEGSDKLWISITGETPTGGFDIGILSQDETKLVFMERLPAGKWRFSRPIAMTPDLGQFAIVFANRPGTRSSIRVDAARFEAMPANSCEAHRIAVSYNDTEKTKTSVDGLLVPDGAGLASYYFPVTWSPNVSLTSVDLGGLSTRCVVDWSIATNFPVGTPPAELLLIDGRLSKSTRGDWQSLWRSFLNM